TCGPASRANAAAPATSRGHAFDQSPRLRSCPGAKPNSDDGPLRPKRGASDRPSSVDRQVGAVLVLLGPGFRVRLRGGVAPGHRNPTPKAAAPARLPRRHSSNRLLPTGECEADDMKLFYTG